MTKKLSSLADKNSSELVASRFQMVGLNRVLGQLENNSEETAKQVFAIAHKTLQDHLSAEDVYEPYELSFLVCFANLDPIQAAEKARKIEADIEEDILGDGLNPDVSDITAETRSLKVSSEELSQSADGLSLIAMKFSQKSELVKSQLKFWSKKFIATCEINYSPVITQTGKCAGFQLAKFGQHYPSEIRKLLRIGADATEIAAETGCILVRRASELPRLPQLGTRFG